jgi:hypothetical protein
LCPANLSLFLNTIRQRGGNHVLSVTAIVVDAGNFAIDAHREISAPAFIADEIVSTVPADADALTQSPRSDVITNRIDPPRDFVTGNPRILNGQNTFLDDGIAMTDSARFNLQKNFAWFGFRNVTFN